MTSTPSYTHRQFITRRPHDFLRYFLLVVSLLQGTRMTSTPFSTRLGSIDAVHHHEFYDYATFYSPLHLHEFSDYAMFCLLSLLQCVLMTHFYAMLYHTF